MNMLRPSILTIALGAGLVFTASPGLCSTAHASKLGSPKPWLKKKVDQAHKLSQRKVKPGSKAEKVWQNDAKVLIDDMLDWPEMTEKSLGREWKNRTPAEQKQFSELLREMIEASYRSKLKMASKGSVKKPSKVKIDWLKEEVKGNKAVVEANVKADKREAVLEFKMLHKNGRWQVYDLGIDDVSTVRTYRSQFRKLIKQEGFEELIKRMKTKIADIKSGRATLER